MNISYIVYILPVGTYWLYMLYTGIYIVITSYLTSLQKLGFKYYKSSYPTLKSLLNDISIAKLEIRSGN